MIYNIKIVAIQDILGVKDHKNTTTYPYKYVLGQNIGQGLAKSRFNGRFSLTVSHIFSGLIGFKLTI